MCTQKGSHSQDWRTQVYTLQGVTLRIGGHMCTQCRVSLSGSEGTCVHSAWCHSQDWRAHMHTVQGVHLLELPPCVLEAGSLAVI